LKKIRSTFNSIDTDSSGNISIEELKLALEKYGIDEDLEQLMRDLDYNKDGEINFSEFVAATIDWQAYMTHENLKVAFDHFDTESNGEISKNTISKCFIRASKEMDEKEIEEMIQEVSGKDTINFEEFVNVMTDFD
jgi:calcium-dependent protein kinase